jgi:hypothetical protein
VNFISLRNLQKEACWLVVVLGQRVKYLVWGWNENRLAPISINNHFRFPCTLISIVMAGAEPAGIHPTSFVATCDHSNSYLWLSTNPFVLEKSRFSCLSLVDLGQYRSAYRTSYSAS